MRTERQKTQSEGFTLAAVLVVMAAMLLMAVGVMAVVGIERKTARSYVDSKRAEWVARAGMDGVARGLTEGATHYHTTSVRPAWAGVYHQTARIGVHVFYRHDYRTASND